MSSATVRVGPVFALVLLGLAGAAALAAYAGRLGLGRATLTAAVRAVVQLAAVSLVIVAVLRSGWWTTGFVTLMFAVATVTAGRRTEAGSGRLLLGVAIGAGVGPALAALLATGLVAWRPVAVLPIAGILIGGAMSAAGLAGRRALDDLRDRYGEYEARLALGYPTTTARRDICRAPGAQALLPALDQTRTVGLVTLPGAFVGVLLGGASPLQAGATQLLVLIALLAVETFAVLVTVELIARGKLAREPGQGSYR